MSFLLNASSLSSDPLQGDQSVSHFSFEDRSDFDIPIDHATTLDSNQTGLNNPDDSGNDSPPYDTEEDEDDPDSIPAISLPESVSRSEQLLESHFVEEAGLIGAPQSATQTLTDLDLKLLGEFIDSHEGDFIFSAQSQPSYQGLEVANGVPSQSSPFHDIVPTIDIGNNVQAGTHRDQKIPSDSDSEREDPNPISSAASLIEVEDKDLDVGIFAQRDLPPRLSGLDINAGEYHSDIHMRSRSTSPERGISSEHSGYSSDIEMANDTRPSSPNVDIEITDAPLEPSTNVESNVNIDAEASAEYDGDNAHVLTDSTGFLAPGPRNDNGKWERSQSQPSAQLQSNTMESNFSRIQQTARRKKRKFVHRQLSLGDFHASYLDSASRTPTSAPFSYYPQAEEQLPHSIIPGSPPSKSFSESEFFPGNTASSNTSGHPILESTTSTLVEKLHSLENFKFEADSHIQELQKQIEEERQGPPWSRGSGQSSRDSSTHSRSRVQRTSAEIRKQMANNKLYTDKIDELQAQIQLLEKQLDKETEGDSRLVGVSKKQLQVKIDSITASERQYYEQCADLEGKARGGEVQDETRSRRSGRFFKDDVPKTGEGNYQARFFQESLRRVGAEERLQAAVEALAAAKESYAATEQQWFMTLEEKDTGLDALKSMTDLMNKRLNETLAEKDAELLKAYTKIQEQNISAFGLLGQTEGFRDDVQELMDQRMMTTAEFKEELVVVEKLATDELATRLQQSHDALQITIENKAFLVDEVVKLEADIEFERDLFDYFSSHTELLDACIKQRNDFIRQHHSQNGLNGDPLPPWIDDVPEPDTKRLAEAIKRRIGEEANNDPSGWSESSGTYPDKSRLGSRGSPRSGPKRPGPIGSSADPESPTSQDRVTRPLQGNRSIPAGQYLPELSAGESDTIRNATFSDRSVEDMSFVDDPTFCETDRYSQNTDARTEWNRAHGHTPVYHAMHDDSDDDREVFNATRLTEGHMRRQRQRSLQEEIDATNDDESIVPDLLVHHMQREGLNRITAWRDYIREQRASSLASREARERRLEEESRNEPSQPLPSPPIRLSSFFAAAARSSSDPSRSNRISSDTAGEVPSDITGSNSAPLAMNDLVRESLYSLSSRTRSDPISGLMGSLSKRKEGSGRSLDDEAACRLSPPPPRTSRRPFSSSRTIPEEPGVRPESEPTSDELIWLGTKSFCPHCHGYITLPPGCSIQPLREERSGLEADSQLEHGSSNTQTGASLPITLTDTPKNKSRKVKFAGVQTDEPSTNTSVGTQADIPASASKSHGAQPNTTTLPKLSDTQVYYSVPTSSNNTRGETLSTGVNINKEATDSETPTSMRRRRSKSWHIQESVTQDGDSTTFGIHFAPIPPSSGSPRSPTQVDSPSTAPPALVVTPPSDTSRDHRRNGARHGTRHGSRAEHIESVPAITRTSPPTINTEASTNTNSPDGNELPLYHTPTTPTSKARRSERRSSRSAYVSHILNLDSFSKWLIVACVGLFLMLVVWNVYELIYAREERRTWLAANAVTREFAITTIVTKTAAEALPSMTDAAGRGVKFLATIFMG
ncbi:hypothetical protein MMC25_007352 [Agyrium rufum]|nr:hypothetical protein [Agyrium rufum]